MQNTEDDEEEAFRFGTQVEISSNEKGFKNCWYKCTIIAPPNSHSMQKRRRRKKFYYVEYHHIVDKHDPTKPLKEYVEASFIRPLPPPPPPSACTRKLALFDVVEAQHRDGWWVGVVVQVVNDGVDYLVAFVYPFEKLVFSREKLRFHLIWLGGDQWILPPKKNVVHFLQDGNETISASQVELILARVKSSAKRLKHGRSDLAAPPPQSAPLSLSEGNIKITTPQSAAQNARTVLHRKITHSDDSAMAGTHLSSTPCLDRYDAVRLLAEKRGKRKLGNNKKNDGGKSYSKKKRDYPAKKPVQRVLGFMQHGEEPGESNAMRENAIEHSPTSDAAGSHFCSFPKEIQVTEIVDEINDVEKVVEEQGGCWALVLYSNPALTERLKSDPATLGANSRIDTSHSWPFAKRSGMWKVIESMEVFKRIPQMPHFSPLNEQEENRREMIAICLMIKFAYEVERINTGSLHDLQNTSIIHESFDNLKELELYGFSTSPLQTYLTELLEKIGRENELQEKLKEAESGIRKCKAEKTEAERMLNEVVEQIKSLEEQIKSSESVKHSKEQQLAGLEFVKGRISGDLERLRLAKKPPPMEW